MVPSPFGAGSTKEYDFLSTRKPDKETRRGRKTGEGEVVTGGSVRSLYGTWYKTGSWKRHRRGTNSTRSLEVHKYIVEGSLRE